jgi:SpoVK/Ycf46/Vps4 family AAA+-type ATPase
LVFCDEIDSLGSSREGETHEVTRRTLSVLLRHLDGLEGPQESILVAATNMPGLLDPALMSRFDVVVSFDLPDLSTRAAILGRYAKQLTAEEKNSLAQVADGFSGRELRDACEAAERAHAGRVVRVRAASEASTEGRSGSGLAAVEGCIGVPEGDRSPEYELPKYDDYLTAISRKSVTSIGRGLRATAVSAMDRKAAMAA